MEKESVFNSLNIKEILLLPNLITYVRFILLPFIIYYYAVAQDYKTTIILIIISFISDLLDGFVARKFNMVSNIGKVADPLADKLTQGCIAIALCFRYKLMIAFTVIFGVGHIATFIFGFINAKKNNEVNSAKWHGKACTGIILTSLVALIVFYDLDIRIVNTLIVLMTVASIVNTTLYSIGFIKKLKKE